MREGWQPITDCPIAETREETVPVFVWHVFQGAMISDTAHAAKNSFHVYWQPLPQAWIDPNERLPGQEDADEQRCIAVVDRYGHLRMIGWEQIGKPSDIRGWIPCPKPPPDARALRQRENDKLRRLLWN